MQRAQTLRKGVGCVQKQPSFEDEDGRSEYGRANVAHEWFTAIFLYSP
jgi:hypothetical protein